MAWIPLFFLVALIYASVGFAGGSTYLALLVLMGVSYEQTPMVALMLNMVVSAGSLFHFVRKGLLPYKKLLPFFALSIPMAYVGGRLPVSKEFFLVILGFSLAVAGCRLIFFMNPPEESKISNQVPWGISLMMGAILGLLSGMVGIGGGIFLAPLLYWLRFGSGREIAASASFFIFVNSLSGFGGHIVKSGLSFNPFVLALVGAVFLGGQVGNHLSLYQMTPKGFQRVTGVLILLISFKIFWELRL